MKIESGCPSGGPLLLLLLLLFLFYGRCFCLSQRHVMTAAMMAQLMVNSTRDRPSDMNDPVGDPDEKAAVRLRWKMAALAL